MIGQHLVTPSAFVFLYLDRPLGSVYFPLTEASYTAYCSDYRMLSWEEILDSGVALQVFWGWEEIFEPKGKGRCLVCR